MLLTLLLGPLLCSLIIWILPFYTSKKLALLTIAHCYLGFIIIWLYYFFSICKNYYGFYYLTLGAWMHTGSFYTLWGFVFDSISVLMFGLVLIVSTSVHFFSLVCYFIKSK